MKKMLLLIMVFLLTATVITGNSGCSKGTIRIGAILSITGGGEVGGTAVRDGLLMAVDDVNANGGINGKQIELIVRDSETDPEKAIAAFRSLESEFQPDMYISSHSVNSMALASLAEENKVVLLGLVTSTPEFTSGYEWVYRYYANGEDEIEPVIQTLDELSIEDLGILYLDESYGNSVNTLLSTEFLEAGGKVSSVALAMDTSDYSAEVSQVADHKAVYAVAYPNYAERVVDELRKIGYNGTIIVSSGCSNPTTVAKPKMEGVYVAAPRIYDQDFSFAENIRAKFENTYDTPLTHYAANGYDTIKLLANLLTDHEVSRESIKELLNTVFIHPGILGTIYIQSGNHDISMPVYPARIVNGRLEFRY